MSDLFESLKNEFQDKDYRYAYAESFLNTKLAAQIKTLREQRRMTQAEVAGAMGITQPGYRRFEDVNHAVWRTDSLWNIARALGVRLDVSFKTFGTLPSDKRNLNKESLQLPIFEDDPAFREEPQRVQPDAISAINSTGTGMGAAGIANTSWGFGMGQITAVAVSDLPIDAATTRPDRRSHQTAGLKPKKGKVIPFPHRSEKTEVKRREYARRKLKTA